MLAFHALHRILTIIVLGEEAVGPQVQEKRSAAATGGGSGWFERHVRGTCLLSGLAFRVSSH